MATFTIHVKYKGGKREPLEKAITFLKTYLTDVVKGDKTFDSSNAVLVEDGTTPAILDTDVMVYMVRKLDNSVIKAQKGSVALAEANDKVLGLTDCNKKICEVYADRMYQDSAKELAGAIYHEAAHIKANQGNAMHTGKDGFLKDAPDYNGTPTDDNNKFFRGVLATKVTMNTSY
jgi:hypothetical protein